MNCTTIQHRWAGCSQLERLPEKTTGFQPGFYRRAETLSTGWFTPQLAFTGEVMRSCDSRIASTTTLPPWLISKRSPGMST